MRKNSCLLFLLSIALMFGSCDSNRIYDEFVSMPEGVFEAGKPVEFQFSITDSITTNNIYIQIRNNKDYAFSNLYLITEMQYPKGSIVVDTLQYEMADARGRFLGSGASDIKENVLCYYEDCTPKPFSTTGDFKFRIRQAMRRNGEVTGIQKLEGITDVGLRIEKTK